MGDVLFFTIIFLSFYLYMIVEDFFMNYTEKGKYE